MESADTEAHVPDGESGTGGNLSQPTVSVVMPVYGAERYIGDAVRSILQQTMSQFELIVVDDCTADRSIAIAQSFDDPRLRVIHHGSNRGLSEARNTGIRGARGRLIALLDADDVATPHRLAAQVQAFEREPELIACGGSKQCIDANGRFHGSVHWHETDPDRIGATMLFRNPFCVSTMMFRRSVFDSVLYRSDVRVTEDYEFMVRASRLGRVRNIPTVLVHYRVHPTSLTSTKLPLLLDWHRTIAREQLRELGIDASERQMDLHMQAALPDSRIDVPLLRDLLGWLQRLTRENQSVRRYSQQALDDVIADSWFEACTVAAANGPRTLAQYLRSGLPGRTCVPASRKLKFAVKALLHLPRRSRVNLRSA